MMALGRAAALAWAAFSVAATQDVGYHLLYETAADDFSNQCVSISKELPSWAHGDFVIGSVGVQELGDRHFVGYLDAFGKYNKFQLKDGQVCATYRMMRSGFYNESVKANTIGPGLLFYETEPARKCPWYNPACNLPPLAPNDNTFVNTFMHGGQLLSLTDSPYMLTIDPESLNVTGTKKWTDKVAGLAAVTGSAHPLKHPKTGEFIDFVGNQNFLTGTVDVAVYSMSDKQPDERLAKASVEMSTPPYMHSFGVTERHAVLPRMPIKFGLPLGKPMSAAFQELELTEPGPDNAFHIVPLDGGETIVRHLPVEDRLYYIHHANTYENESGVVIDLTVANGNVFSGDLTTKDELNKTFRDSCYHDAKPCINWVRRFLLPLKGEGVITSEVISDLTVKTDFVRINKLYHGRKHCFYWGVQWWSDHKNKASMAIAKYDLCSNRPPAESKIQWARPNWYPSEAILVPSTEPGAAEDDGMLLFTALDGTSGQTWLIVVDAKTMESHVEAGPFPRIAFTTHGEFYPAAAQASREQTAHQAVTYV